MCNELSSPERVQKEAAERVKNILEKTEPLSPIPPAPIEHVLSIKDSRLPGVPLIGVLVQTTTDAEAVDYLSQMANGFSKEGLPVQAQGKSFVVRVGQHDFITYVLEPVEQKGAKNA